MMHRKSGSILVSARQSISIFGLWDQPRQILEWQDITARNLTWRNLRDSLELTPEQLKQVQPSVEDWVNRASITLNDLPDMVCFPVNPFVHLHADLAEVWSMHWTSDILKQLNVTFDQLRAKGMTVQVMQHFNFTLGQWMNLGLMQQHIKGMDDDGVRRVFDMPKEEVLEVIAHYEF
jgi:hypothetical protein